MRSRVVAAFLCTLALVACGGGSPEAIDAEPPPTIALTPLPTTPGDLAGTTTPPAAPAAPASTSTSAPGTTAPGAAAPTTAAASPAPAVGTGLVQGTVTRSCGDGGVGGGSGCPVAEAAVELRNPGGSVLATTRTNAAGEFTFSPAAGRYVIREAATGIFAEQDVAAGRPTVVVLVLPATSN
ncbi:MAG: carboxypeptidase-like regulatory domain-containing protein [Acidimicrobiales bacterium]